MPRDGSGVYSADWVNAAPNTTIESSKQNALVADLVTDANAARPITSGGTGETTARLKDGTWRLQNTSDTTKLVAFDLSGLTTATTRTVTVPDESARMALAPHLAGQIYGLTLSNNGTDATNDIDIAAGYAIDALNTHVMTLGSALTKRLDAAWAVGTGNGGLDTGSIANTTYHIHLIKRVDTGVVDALFSTSPTSPTMPANYTLSRRIGSIIRSGAAILGFVQNGDEFTLQVPVSNPDVTNPGTSAITVTLEVPSNLLLVASITAILIDTSPGAATGGLISNLAVTDTAPVASTLGQLQTVASAGAQESVATLSVRTNTSRQIRARLSDSTADHILRVTTFGWVDTRGRT